MGNINNKQNQRCESTQVILSFLRIFGESPVHEVFQRNRQSEDVDESENFKPVVRPLFVVKEQAWNGSNKVKDEVPLQVTATDAAEVFVSSAVLNEIQEDLNSLNDIYRKLDLVKSKLCGSFECITSIVIGDVNILENNNIWEHDQVVNDEQSNEKVPNDARVLLGVN